MPRVEVIRRHALGFREARARMGKLEDEVTVFGVDVNWSAEEREASLRGDGVSGWIRVGDDQVEVVVELGALAEAASVRPEPLRESIERTLHEALA